MSEVLNIHRKMVYCLARFKEFNPCFRMRETLLKNL